MNNTENLNPEAKQQLEEIEYYWSRLSWIEKKKMIIKLKVVVYFINHIMEMELLRARIIRKTNHFVLYYIFPAHWLKQ